MNIFSAVFGEHKEHLSGEFEGFESRPQQVRMARAVQDALFNGRHLMVEAGTGVGKSLAYLVPLAEWVTGGDKRVVVSTYTKTLQQQLVSKDLPFLRDILGTDLRFALCLGSRNYLCRRRLERSGGPRLFPAEEEGDDVSRIREWAEGTATGLRSELDFAPSESGWGRVCRESDLCLGKKCPFRKECFYFSARAEEHKAQILVTNHHLFFANLASGGRVLPRFDSVVFDEAHTLEDVATGYLGLEVSNFQMKFFLDALFNPKSGRGFLVGLSGASAMKVEDAKAAAGEVRGVAESFFSEVSSKVAKEGRVTRIRERVPVPNTLDEPLERLERALKSILMNAPTEEDELELKSFISRAGEFRSCLDDILNMRMDDYVYWLENAKRTRGTKRSLFASPVDISFEFRKKVLTEIDTVIMTSATLSAGGSFEFVKKRLGAGDDVDEIIVDSPFDYARQALLYLPGGLPDPGLGAEAFQLAALEEVKRILSVMKGRTFVLFTSFRAMNGAYAEIKRHFKGLVVLKQGDAPRYRLLEMFRRGDNAILLGTNTFWQGIDVPGKDLECVIINKLPFAVPDEPVAEAKMELLHSQGKSPFLHYQIPRAAIMLKQGFGRLIRTSRDKGVVAILDPRIKTKGYGKRFLKTLPPCNRVSELAEVERFFLNS